MSYDLLRFSPLFRRFVSVAASVRRAFLPELREPARSAHSHPHPPHQPKQTQAKTQEQTSPKAASSARRLLPLLPLCGKSERGRQADAGARGFGAFFLRQVQIKRVFSTHRRSTAEAGAPCARPRSSLSPPRRRRPQAGGRRGTLLRHAFAAYENPLYLLWTRRFFLRGRPAGPRRPSPGTLFLLWKTRYKTRCITFF